MPNRPPKTSLCFLRGWAACLGLCGALVAAPELRAGGADGFYKPTSVEGSVSFAGRTYKLPLKALRKALLGGGVVPVVANRIPMKRIEWEDLVEDFEFREIKGKATASGPSNIIFTKKGNRYVGQTNKPLVVEQKGKYRFVPVRLFMRTNLHTVVKGDKLTMTAPIEIHVLGLKSKGWIRMEATKMELPPFPPEISVSAMPARK